MLDALLKQIRHEAGAQLERIPYAEKREECERLRDAFVGRYRKEYPKAVEKLLRAAERLGSHGYVLLLP